jgi:putative sterol carrier protein
MKSSNRYLSLAIAAIVMAVCLGAMSAASNETSSSTPQQVFDGMRQSFQANKAKGVHARYQWELSGPNGGEWWIDVNDGTYTMGRGKIDNPSVTFVTSDKNWVALSNGTLGGKWAFFTGRLKIHGDQNLARKLDEIFP